MVSSSLRPCSRYSTGAAPAGDPSGHTDLAGRRLRQDHRHRRAQAQHVGEEVAAHESHVGLSRTSRRSPIPLGADPRTSATRSQPNLLACADARPQDRHAACRDRLRRDPGRTGDPGALPGRCRGARPSRRVGPAARARTSRRTSRSSPSIRSDRWTWTRPSTWPGTVTATWCGMRSPTSRPSSRPAGALAAETWRRGATLYSPDTNTPLHPVELSEGAASLLPGDRRPAVLWTIGWTRRASRSRSTSGGRRSPRWPSWTIRPCRPTPTPAPCTRPSRCCRRSAGCAWSWPGERHAISLDIPDAEIVRRPDGHWTLELRAGAGRRAVQRRDQPADRDVRGDDHAGRRDRPAPHAAVADRRAGAALRRATAVLGIPWPASMPPGDVIARPERGRATGRRVPGGRRPAAPRRRVHPVRRRAAEATRARRGGRAVCARDGAAAAAGGPVRHRGLPGAARRPAGAGLGPGGAAGAAEDDGRPRTERHRNWPRPARVRCRCSCCTAGRARSSRPPCCRSKPTADRAIVILHEPPVRAHCDPAGLVEGSVITVRLRLRRSGEPHVRGDPGRVSGAPRQW